MSERIPPLTPGEPNPLGAARNVQATERGAARFRLVTGTKEVAPRPPADVLNALDSAALVHDELHSRGMNVSFDVQSNGSVRISVLDEHGAVVHVFPGSSAALAAFGGDAPLELDEDRLDSAR